MEVAVKNQNVKKKRKKKKQSNADEGKKFVKPEYFDGMTNWLNLQKVEKLLLQTSQFFLWTLSTFLLIPSVLCAIISQSIEQVQPYLIYISKKVLDKVQKEKLPENSSAPQKNTQKPVKNLANKKSHQKKTRKISKKGENKAEFKFDFSERHSAILASQSRKNTSGVESSRRRISESEMSDTNAEPMDPKQLTKVLAMDCEMVGTGSDGADSIVARVSIVNSYGECVYDEYVTPKEKVTDYRTDISGIRPSDLNKGKDLFEVQKDVLDIIDGRRIVGHDLKHDFDVLFISHPRSLIRDTSKYKPFRDVSGGRTPSLKKLVAVILGCSIQGGEHSSVEDAQAAMLLYLKHKKEWERSIKSTRKRRPAN